ncbi:hypothetical protein LCGC14_0945400 [marine sediment metagenome]|uniref:Uncharacterized protein n=1 Tax=marine sediment metagenome TaxID=412755 RepID=A0A0F9RQ78_9ZZZZ
MGQIVSIFITILIVSVIAALTFLFVGALKSTSLDITAITSVTVTNESGAYINTTGYTVTDATKLGFRSFVITAAYNATAGVGTLIGSGNYTVNSATGIVTNASTTTWSDVNISYTYVYVSDENANAYIAVNTTEAAGLTVVGFLSILFLALIFSAILTVVLRFVLPFMNLGNQLGGF